MYRTWGCRCRGKDRCWFDVLTLGRVLVKRIGHGKQLYNVLIALICLVCCYCFLMLSRGHSIVHGTWHNTYGEIAMLMIYREITHKQVVRRARYLRQPSNIISFGTELGT